MDGCDAGGGHLGRYEQALLSADGVYQCPTITAIMNLREVLAPQSSERIVLVVLAWALLSAGLAEVLDAAIVRWEVLLSGVIVFGWAVWAINYRIEQSRKERYQEQ